jgi:glycerophosphoryl diester phosphodiesterase
MLIIGHRGYPYRYPENTVASLLAALLYGADGVEFDVWKAGDGELVVVHDRSLRRVAGVDVDVKKASYSEIARYSLGLGQHVPRLCDVIDALPETALLMVEVKDPEATLDVYKCLRDRGRLEHSIILSFHDQVLRRLRELDNRLRLGFNVGGLEAAEQAFKLHTEIRLHVVNVPAESLKVIGADKVLNYLIQLRKLGIRAGMWGVNSREIAENLSDYLDVIITDNVEEIVRLRRE